MLFAFAACGGPAPAPDHSSSASTAGTAGDAAQSSGPGQSPDGGGAPQGVVVEAGVGPGDAGDPTVSCGALGKDACVACCNIAYPDVETAFRASLAKCVCVDPGECASSCGQDYCTGAAMSDACASCIQGSSVCRPATLAVCESAPACSAYLDCLDACH
jgi:hypothetical protein